MTDTLFQRLLGAEFAHLAPQVRALHSRPGRFRWRGICSIQRGTHPLARLACMFARLPPSMQDVPVSVEFTSSGDEELWQRDFNGVPMRSRLRFDGGQLHERLGPMTFRFHVHRDGEALHWTTIGARLFGLLPLPSTWFTQVRCRESEADGRYRFLVDARLPWVGPLIRYQGWLEPDDVHGNT